MKEKRNKEGETYLLFQSDQLLLEVVIEGSAWCSALCSMVINEERKEKGGDSE